ncbi:AraC family transcriptional regulator [Aquimarina sp. 2201CG1-2-11]|uniref:helix-turn-helix domain-containing protein n=1 Tax=Aquimarina discodermiae TaxID=3231043 RepID=UPI0034638353
MTTSILFLVGNCFVLFRTIYETFYDYQGLTLLNLGISLFGLGVICWFMLKTMHNPELFTGIDKDIKPLEKGTIEEKEKYHEEIDHISRYMTTQKPYLEETLTLQSLAQKIGIPEKQLSFLINKVVGKHFFDFINTYRIQEAKTLLQDKELNIQEIMYKVGFNSKSSFNTAFKKNVSTTPSNYRKSNT